MIETVIFDMDGVIIDSEPIHQELQYQLFQLYNIHLEPGEYQTFIGRSSKNMWQELIDRYSLPVTIDQVLQQDRNLYHARLKTEPGLSPIPGIPDLIENLKREKIKLVLASSSSMSSIDLVLELFQLAPYFEHRVSGADLKFSKPHPEIFEVAAGISHSRVDHCLVIEDSNHGVTAAKRARMKCVGFRNPNSGNQDLSEADLVVDDIRTLTIDCLQSLGTDGKPSGQRAYE